MRKKIQQRKRIMFSLIGLIAPIISEGLKFLNEKQRTRIQDEYFDILELLDQHRILDEDYSDIELAFDEMRLESFLKAYAVELRNVKI